MNKITSFKMIFVVTLFFSGNAYSMEDGSSEKEVEGGRKGGQLSDSEGINSKLVGECAGLLQKAAELQEQQKQLQENIDRQQGVVGKIPEAVDKVVQEGKRQIEQHVQESEALLTEKYKELAQAAEGLNKQQIAMQKQLTEASAEIANFPEKAEEAMKESLRNCANLYNTFAKNARNACQYNVSVAGLLSKLSKDNSISSIDVSQNNEKVLLRTTYYHPVISQHTLLSVIQEACKGALYTSVASCVVRQELTVPDLPVVAVGGAMGAVIGFLESRRPHVTYAEVPAKRFIKAHKNIISPVVHQKKPFLNE